MFPSMVFLQLYFLMSFDALHCQEPEDQSYFREIFVPPHQQTSHHVGNQTLSDGAKVEKYLREDTVKSVKPWLTEIMNNYKVKRAILVAIYLELFRLPRVASDLLLLVIQLLPFFTLLISYKCKYNHCIV